jgi:twinkle protein
MKEPGGKIIVPGAYDISGSAHWYNIADDILSVWRDIPAKDSKSQVHVLKVRFEEVGKAGGHCAFNFVSTTGKFIDIGEVGDVGAKVTKYEAEPASDSFAAKHNKKQKGIYYD